MRYAASLPTRPPVQKPPHNSPSPQQDQVTRLFYANSDGKRIYTDTIMREAISEQYPELRVTAIPEDQLTATVNFLVYASAGFATATPIEESNTCPLKIRQIFPAARRTEKDIISDRITFGKYEYKFKDYEPFVLYMVDCKDGTDAYYSVLMQYIVGPDDEVANDLLSSASSWFTALHNEVYVYDQGYWSKSSELYDSVEKASWHDVILEQEMKNAIQDDVSRFFKSQEKYDSLRVPWKRGLIFHGPPGNGKTISIKAIMHSLYHLETPIPSLYVRSFTNFAGPEAAVKQIFSLARRQAPCILIFEDLDSFVTDDVKSYFFNEVDGISQSLGVFMLGSTNHLDRLDPGISQRPSRFDRKFLFPLPSYDQRVQYCEYWREKLKGTKGIDFPHALSKAIAKITDEFSYAYMQEAFVASLLTIAGREDSQEGVAHKSDDDLDDNILWQEMKKQVKILKGEL